MKALERMAKLINHAVAADSVDSKPSKYAEDAGSYRYRTADGPPGPSAKKRPEDHGRSRQKNPDPKYNRPSDTVKFGSPGRDRRRRNSGWSTGYAPAESK